MSYTVVSAEIRMNTVDQILSKRGLNKGGRVQMAIDRSVIKYCMPYVPKDTGILESSPYTASVIGSGKVVYPGPYARFHYYGKVMTTEDGRVWAHAGEKKPIVTNRDLDHDKTQNPLAGPFWFERMKADRLNDIVKEAKSVAGIK